MATAGAGRSTIVDAEIRGVIDLADYAMYLSRFQRCGIVAGSEPATVSLAFPVERRWCYAGVLVRQRAPGVVRIEVDAPPESVETVVEQVCRALSLDVDGGGFAAVADGDPVLRHRLRANPGLRPVLFCSPYEAACWAVVCHRFRVAQADAVIRRIAMNRGRVFHVGGREIPSFPVPQELGVLDSSYGVSERKRRSLSAIADAALSGELDADRLRALPVFAAVEAVRRLPGLGPFSAELVVGRGAGHPDLFPASEAGLATTLRRCYGVDDVGVVTERWRPYRGWGAFFLRETVTDEQ